MDPSLPTSPAVPPNQNLDQILQSLDQQLAGQEPAKTEMSAPTVNIPALTFVGITEKQIAANPVPPVSMPTPRSDAPSIKEDGNFSTQIKSPPPVSARLPVAQALPQYVPSADSGSGWKKRLHFSPKIAFGFVLVFFLAIGSAIAFKLSTEKQDIRQRAADNNCCGTSGYSSCSTDREWADGYQACITGNCAACQKSSVCGNNSCDPGENQTNCSQDCKPDGGSIPSTGGATTGGTTSTTSGTQSGIPPKGSIGQKCLKSTDVVCPCKIGEVCSTEGGVAATPTTNGTYCYPGSPLVTQFKCTKTGTNTPSIDPNATKENDICNLTTGNRGACGVGCSIGFQLTCAGTKYVCTKTDACAPPASTTEACLTKTRQSYGEPSHGAFIGCSGVQNCFCPSANLNLDGRTFNGGNITCFPDAGNDSCGAPGKVTTSTSPTLKACNDICDDDDDQCGGGMQCISDRCRNAACSTATNCTCTTATSTPNVSPPPFVCLSITMDTTTPKLGTSVRFTCGKVAAATSYEFRYKIDSGAAVSLASGANGSNISNPLTITNTGKYKVQCRPCVGSSCSPFETW